MPDTITSMRVFISAVRLGSFAAAAEKMAMSPQMVARHVAALERRLATRLLNRTTRRHSLTAAGRDYYQRCLHILDEIERAEENARTQTTQPAGSLRLNAPVTFGRYVLMPFITGFLARYPAIHIDVVLSDALSDPLEGGYDVVIRIGEANANLRQVAVALPPYRLMLCAAPAYLRQAGIPQQPAALSAHQCLIFSPWQAGLSHRWILSGPEGETEVAVNGRLAVNDWGGLLQAALDGAGILAGYDRALQSSLNSAALIPVLTGYTFPLRPLHALYHPG
ncbi:MULTISPECIES: LysR family transcriptional regulator [unclassified Erwinia]|uniref:LysR family transcriptional regulator n=1 Tax=unclassified Erwinia TaxID=2622719 RepID=UPI000C184CF6|nr:MULTISPECIES: LysR family transcriptional regulator [unclassified Erwinia]PIJ48195.1 LysR family transcriptional regulator [Erwinia sp. OAMSP11]PIJ67730.1 LysR family transcriptional regulator [Erwinia sp. OLSSP12]PIJ78590.1 LysR family transcriptional regulator [Erwinia sp. OLCASP19]PIJ79345.1 LysR family transcriptional regulator [Erwinia sp. OLMTSP26]PIJ80605.1 LysR family transcriptional regulator [Erwinia sp. OLMDSP33]